MRLQRHVVVVGRRRHRLHDGLEQGLEVVAVRHRAVVRAVERRAARAGGGVDDGEVERDVRVQPGAVDEVHEQLVRLLDDLGDPRVRPVDLVDHEDDRQVRLQRLAQHETGLRQRALGGVDEQRDAVHHRQPALDLAAEVGVAGGVDDVERHTALGRVLPRPPHGGVLGEDRDALLALEVVGVHRPLVDVGVLAERAGLPEHGVDEGGLAVVDVGDDGDVAQVVAGARGHA